MRRSISHAHTHCPPPYPTVTFPHHCDKFAIINCAILKKKSEHKIETNINIGIRELTEKGLGRGMWLKGKTAYIILINFLDDIFKVKIIKTMFLTGLLYFINGNWSTSILVKVLKGCNEMFLAFKLVQMDSSSYELTIINCTAVVDISLQYLTKNNITVETQQRRKTTMILDIYWKKINWIFSKEITLSNMDDRLRCRVSSHRCLSHNW